ncbi:MAG: DHA2 family efflux MFS transporter permease subunit, partial [Hyphomonadaceae bacterium]
RLQAPAGAMLGLVMTLAPSIGPTLGGYISEHLGWRALFYINIIPGFLIAFLVWRNMKLGGFNADMFRRIDFLGLVGLAAMLGAAQYVLEEGTGESWFQSGEIVFWTCVSASGALLFFWRTLGNDHPIVDLRPFKVPTFAIGCALGFVVGASLYGPVFLQPLFMAEVRGYNPEQIGHSMFAQGATMFVMAPIMGYVGRAIPDLRPIGFIGFLLIATSCWMQAHLTRDSAFWEFLYPQVLRGAGMMICFMSIMQPTIQSLPLNLIQSGTPLFNLCRNLGGAFGLAALSTVQARSYLMHRHELFIAADPNNARVRQMIEGAAQNAPPGADPDRLGQVFYAHILEREALVMAFNDGFLMLAVALACASFAIFALKRAAPPAPGTIEPAH